MKGTNRAILKNLLLTCSLDTAEERWRYGMVPDRVMDLYKSLWRNGNYRLSLTLVHYERAHWRTLARQAINCLKGE